LQSLDGASPTSKKSGNLTVPSPSASEKRERIFLGNGGFSLGFSKYHGGVYPFGGGGFGFGGSFLGGGHYHHNHGFGYGGGFSPAFGYNGGLGGWGGYSKSLKNITFIYFRLSYPNKTVITSRSVLLPNVRSWGIHRRRKLWL